MSRDEITTRSSVYSRRPDGIVVQRTLPGVAQTVEDAHDNVAAFNQLAAGEPTLLLVDTRELLSQASGVREIYASDESMRNCAAVAVLSGMSGAGRVIGNLFISLGSPKAPTRLFTDEDAALEWLHKVGRLAGLGSS